MNKEYLNSLITLIIVLVLAVFLTPFLLKNIFRPLKNPLSNANRIITEKLDNIFVKPKEKGYISQAEFRTRIEATRSKFKRISQTQ